MRAASLRFAAIAFAVAAAAGGCSQIELGRLYFANNGTTVRLDQPLPLSLPFREENGWVMVEASIDGHPPVDFVIDTGASMMALLVGPATAGLPMDMAGLRRLGPEDDLAAPVAAPQHGLDIDFGPLTLEDQTLLAIPVESIKCSEEIPTPPFQGVIGHELFSRYVVEFDYDRQRMVLHDPGTYAYSGPGQVVPADIEGRQPFVQARVRAPDGRDYDARLHVDSGAGIDLSLFPQTSDDIVVPAVEGEVRNGCFVGGKASYHTGTSVAVAFGDGPALETPASYSLDREVISDGQNGRLGSRFLRRHKVIFDYSRGRMILEPRADASASARSGSVSGQPPASAR